MKKILVFMCLALALTGCGNKAKDKIDNSNINIEEMPDVQGNENVTIDKEGNKINNSSNFSSKKTYDVYEITDASISTNSEGRTTFVAKVKNTSKEEKSGGLVDIILIDKNGNKVSKLPTYIRALASDETMDLNATIDKDLSNAYDYYVEAHKS